MNDSLNQNPLEALYEIKKMMQQSSRIFSLSGWSGIWTGLVGIAGACWMHFIINSLRSQVQYNQEAFNGAIELDIKETNNNLLILDTTQKEYLIWSALAIFFVAIIGAIFFSYRKNKKQGYSVSYNEVARKLLINLIIPIGAGAAFCAQLFQNELYFLLVPCSLILWSILNQCQ